MSRAAESIRRYAPFFQKQQALHVLDYGTGNLRNALFLAGKGFRVVAADLPQQVAKLRACPSLCRLDRLLATDELAAERLNVDLVLSTYVFNIIMEGEGRQQYLQNAVANLRPGGYLLMEVRCRRPQTECGSDCSDYFVCSECPKTLTHEELDGLLRPHGLRRISHYYRHHAVTAIYQMDR